MTTTTNLNVPHVEQLRTHLMETLAALRDREKPMDVDRARAAAQVAGVLVESAKAEVEFLRVTRQENSTFFGGPPALTAPEGEGKAAAGESHSGYTQGEVIRTPGRTVHRLRD